MREEGREQQLTPLPLREVRVCCRVIEVSTEHGFCARMEVVREHQCYERRSGQWLGARKLISVQYLHTFWLISHQCLYSGG